MSYDQRIFHTNLFNLQQGGMAANTGHRYTRLNDKPKKPWWRRLSTWNFRSKVAAVVLLALGAALVGALAYLAWHIVFVAVLAAAVTTTIWLVTMHRAVYDWMAKWGTHLDEADLPLDQIEECLKELQELSKEFNEERDAFYQERVSSEWFKSQIKGLSKDCKHIKQAYGNHREPNREHFLQRVEQKLGAAFATRLNRAMTDRETLQAEDAELYFPELSSKLVKLNTLHDELVKTKDLANELLAKVEVNDRENQGRKKKAAKELELYTTKIADYGSSIRKLTKIQHKLCAACNTLFNQVCKLFFPEPTELQPKLENKDTLQVISARQVAQPCIEAAELAQEPDTPRELQPKLENKDAQQAIAARQVVSPCETVELALKSDMPLDKATGTSVPRETDTAVVRSPQQQPVSAAVRQEHDTKSLTRVDGGYVEPVPQQPKNENMQRFFKPAISIEGWGQQLAPTHRFNSNMIPS